MDAAEQVQVRLSEGVVTHCWAIGEQAAEDPKYGVLWATLNRSAGTRWNTVQLSRWEADRLYKEVCWQIYLAKEDGESVPSPLQRYLRENGLRYDKRAYWR
jgi:hypothetical protein